MLFINNDKTEVLKRKENGAASTKDHIVGVL